MFLPHQTDNTLLNYLRFNAFQLLNTIESRSATSGNTALKDKIDNIHKNLNSSALTLQECCSYEQELLQIYPNELYPTLYLDVCQKYSQVLPVESVEKIKALQILNDIKISQVNNTNIRVNVAAIYKWLQNYYFFINERERFIHQMKSNFIVMLFFLIAVTIISGYYCLNYTGELQISLIIGMASGGYMGAIISTVQRIQKLAETPVDGIDREATLLKIYQGKKGIHLSILLGTLAPFIIFLLVRLIPADKGIVFFGVSFLPIFNERPFSLSTGIGALYLTPEFRDVKDIAKILFISIVSGFSERLVPDVLDRITQEINVKLNHT
uniref:hypothetical protein n=1 Tax=Scandinavium goeteborgense TaxID=1851514 RepID=UPI001359D4F1|nr:hypothetical protein [Scandinavium goeteborgense]